jgi:hypothetical protein
MSGPNAKRPIGDIAGGTAESVQAALGSDSTSTLTDEQLDLVLPSDGYSVLCAPGPTKTKRKTKSAHGVLYPGEPQHLSADEVEAFFVRGDSNLFGGFGDRNGDTFLRMQEMTIPMLEELQGFADDVSAGATSADAQKVGLDWSTEISRFIA